MIMLDPDVSLVISIDQIILLLLLKSKDFVSVHMLVILPPLSLL